MKNKKHKKRRVRIFLILFAILALIGVSIVYWAWERRSVMKDTPEDLIVEYMNHIEKQEYEVMYSMIDMSGNNNLEKEEFVERNSRIYEGIEIKNLQLQNIELGEEKNQAVSVSYDTFFETVAGEVSFRNEAIFKNTDNGYKILWRDSLIFPGLGESDKVGVSTIKAERGEITDRNGNQLAGKGMATSVGVVPGKLENREEALQKVSALLNIDMETIESKLAASWVKEDSFVPITTIPKVKEIDFLKVEPDEDILKEQKRQKQLLTIPGVMLTDIEVRSYELGEAASHLIGYVQGVTAEDLENHPGEGYSSDSVIGRSGVEGLFEKDLKGQDGHKISIIDKNGSIKETIASITKEDGMNIQLTIDANLQKALYEQFKEAPGCSVAMNPYTGEVLALVSTPSYDNNDFIQGMSTEQWNSLNEDENKPLYNRFRQIWCPGSTFKPIIAAVGLKTGAIDPKEDFGNEGCSWQKDASWGSYYVTTLHTYEPVTMKNAMIYSDNIYFAKAALKIGADDLMKNLDEIGFHKELPFDIIMADSQYSNEEKIGTEIQLADSGYGQGQILVNPLYLATIYTAFLNGGNIVKPYLRYQEEENVEIWIPQAFSSDTVNQVMEGLDGVVNHPKGTAYSAHRDDITLAGKTGTAEIKATKEDTEGTEIGWFAVFTEEEDVRKPILMISMVENVKGIGGSNYVVNKDKAVLEEYLK